jgi:LPS sulfotransferase NodH/SAM-dependent methyltransferase
MTSPRIIVCATQRCGSTLVCEDLRNNQLGNAEEHFLRIIGPNRPKDRAVDLQIVENAARGKNGIISIKVMSSYAHQVNQALMGADVGLTSKGKLWPALFGYFHDAIWINVERRSTLRQAVSRVISRHTGINHAVASEAATFVPGRSQIGLVADYNRDVPFRPDEIEHEIISIAVETFRWEQFFTDHGISPIRLVYEEFAKSADYVGPIRLAAGLPGTVSSDPRNLLKLANDKTESIVRQFVAQPRLRRNAQPAAEATPAGPAEARAPVPAADKLADLKKETAVVTQRWVHTPYYEAVEQHARTQWDNLIAPFLKDQDIDYTVVLELAVGHGRMTQILLERAAHVIGVDVLQENIDFCRRRFSGVPNLTLLRNDGVTLDAIEPASVTFLFCFDSMVHFDSDIVRSYLSEFRRILRPGGKAFCHHSNLTRNPDGDFQRAIHARNFMSESLFHHYAHKEGLKLVKSRVINWGKGPRHVQQLDCLSLVNRAAE